jgi:phospholipid/cholesterol/gamma-HCH transport system substrate-binding protein
MSRRVIGSVLLGVLGVVVLLIVIGGGDDRYKVTVQLASATGLRTGSEVKVGGVPVGTIGSLGLGRGDVVQAGLELDPEKVEIRRDASVEIVTSNLLGSKFISLTPGDGAEPLPAGGVIPRTRVSYPTELDQFLDVLDADTRTRLQVLVNELGIAVTGRRADFNQALLLLPKDLASATRLLDEVVSDNQTLGRLVARSSRLVTRLVPERRALSRLVDVAGETLRTTAQRQAQLRQTLARAPGTLRSAQRFLADLRTTAKPLGPAARAITAAAPPLTATLAALPGFERDARPALATATDVAPSLTRLGVQATPVLRRAKPTTRALATFSRNSVPLLRTLDVSIDDVLATAEGWARAIQGRDALGHVFHGLATFSPEVMRILVGRLEGTGAAKARRRGARRQAGKAPQRPAAPNSDALRGTRGLLDKAVPEARGLLDKVLPGSGGLLGGGSPPRGNGDAAPNTSLRADKLLDYLLGP